ncbi:MAG: cytochrome b/b6 domain-containing protein [Hydrogenophaga sp.]|uniref:cytochrome b/b6 domain-containing protein n=1 Tax=Hydrogenophaga sp. TaxID=1904254 RepID=UPI00272F285A|nr:cytochrome b/b6 domain-containing protein [Hydrogenophaga sp.]MDP2165509.1 cytochrome b/b6 domain-containing protein [Hydrogenophaga sp.]MDP3476259.1 cytochrome b/b6 domain-containing protein [Hydrogenophaga sp.]
MQASPTLDSAPGHAAAPAASTASTASAPRRLVTDAPTRMFHGLFALSFLGAYLTADGEHFRLLHVTLGYTMAGLLAFRVLYGLFGPRQAGLGLLWRKLTGLPAWLRSVRSAPSLSAIHWRQAQNLLMALAVFALLVMVLPLTLSGYGTYNDWGDVLGGDWLEEVHEFFGEAFLFVVLAHLALIAGLSLLRRKNQAAPMWSGRVDGPGPNLVQNNRVWLAALLLIAVLAYGAWEWQQSPNGLVSTQSISGLATGDGEDRDRDDD